MRSGTAAAALLRNSNPYRVPIEAEIMLKRIHMIAIWAAVAASALGVTADGAAPLPAAAGAKPVLVQDGNKVDPRTLEGWKTWRALACERCHGAEGEGLAGPSLLASLKSLSKADFYSVVMKGRVQKGMPNYDGSAMMRNNWEGLYDYLKGRSDGKIKPGHLYPLETK
jgi:cytochrome c553